MAYVPVPKDLTKVKTKVAFNLTAGRSWAYRFSFYFGGQPGTAPPPCA